MEKNTIIEVVEMALKCVKKLHKNGALVKEININKGEVAIIVDYDYLISREYFSDQLQNLKIDGQDLLAYSEMGCVVCAVIKNNKKGVK